MTAIDINQQPGHLIRRLHQASVGLFMQHTSDLGLTPVQYAALQILHNQPGIDQRTLARAIALDASTTGGVVDRLEARGWLKRRTDPSDRRARLLDLTPDGEAALRQSVPAMQQTQDAILAPLTPAERTLWLTLQHKLVQHHSGAMQPNIDTGQR